MTVLLWDSDERPAAVSTVNSNSLKSQKLALYLFLDEGGNFDFSQKGTRYFTITSLARVRPFEAYHELSELKYDLLEEGLEIEYFHATEDKQNVRDRVFSIIGKHLDGFRVDSIVVEKRKTYESLQKDIERFYCKLLGILLRYVLNGHNMIEYSQLIIITDRLPNTKGTNLEKAVKKALKDLLPSSTTFRILHHQSKSNFYLQIVDYCNWAIFRKYESRDDRSYNLIRKALRSEFDVFA